MKTRYLLPACLLAISAAQADVAVTTTTAGNAAFINVGGEGVNRIKGKRQRTDGTFGKRAQTLIIDIDNRRFVDLDDKKKSARVTPLDVIADQVRKAGVGVLDATLTRTAATKSVAGFPCTVHDVRVTMPFSPTGNPGDGMDLTMILSGTVCLSTQAPGLAEYQAFYRAAADSGFIFGDPKLAKSPTGAAQARAYATLTRKMAEGGMALESHINISADGNSPLAGMFSKAAKSDITTTVTKIEVGDQPAADFDIPAGYKVKTDK